LLMMPGPNGRRLHSRFRIGPGVLGTRPASVLLEEVHGLQKPHSHYDLSMSQVRAPGVVRGKNLGRSESRFAPPLSPSPFIPANAGIQGRELGHEPKSPLPHGTERRFKHISSRSSCCSCNASTRFERGWACPQARASSITPYALWTCSGSRRRERGSLTPSR
jgi:hypothetical protein